MKPYAVPFNRLMTSVYLVFFCLLSTSITSLDASNFAVHSNENDLIRTTLAITKCDLPIIGNVYPIQGTCNGDSRLTDASVYIDGVSGALKANIAKGSIFQGPSAKDNVSAFFVNEDYVFFDGLEQGEVYTIRIWSQDTKCFLDVQVETKETDCGQCGDITGFVDKPHVHLEPVEGALRKGTPCGPGIVMTEGCNGQAMTLNKSFLNTDRYIALHGNCGAGSSILPACLAYVDDNCEVESDEYAFCFDYNKASGLGAGFNPGTVQFITQIGIDGISTLTPLKAARISWVFEHLSDYGLDIDNSTHRRALQLISWKIINPNEPGVQAFSCDNAALPRVCSGADELVGWCDIFDAAVAAVPDGSDIPFLDISPSNSSALLNESIQLTLQSNEDVVEISVSDGGNLPVICGSSIGDGHQVVDLGGGVGQLVLNGTGLRSVELCFERNASADFTFDAELTTTISDGGSFVIYIPQEPYAETVQPFFSYRQSVLTPKASAQLEFLGELTLECGPDIEFECINFDESLLQDWYNELSVTSDCGVASIENDFNPNNFVGGACSIAGTQVVTFTVTDNCGQVETCQATVTVTNDQEVVWDFLPGDVTLSCADPLPTEVATAFDNCGEVVITFEDVIMGGACDQSYTLIRTFTATDQCGNTAEHAQTITVTDNVPPSFGDGSDCWPSGLATTGFSNPGEANAQFSELLFAAEGRIGDNAMGGAYELSLSNINPFNLFEQADLTWPKGQNVSFEIAYDPNASGNNRLIYTLSSGGTQRVLQLDPASFYDFPLDIDALMITTMTGANTTVEVTNVLVNGQSLNQTFGHTNPASSQNHQSVVTGVNLADGFTITGNALFDWTGVNPPTGDAMKFGFSFGKLACAAGLSCPEDLFVDCSDLNYETTIQNWINSVIATDDCGTAMVTNDYDGSLVCGEYTITFTATDECGNVSTCEATLNITGSGTPNLNVPTAPTLVCGSGNNLDLINNWLSAASATGICGDLIVESDLTAEQILTALSNAAFVVGENCEASISVTFTAQDDCGTNLETSLPISIIDNEIPTITCPSNLVLECGDGNNDVLISTWLNSVSGADNCSDVTVTNNYNPANFSNACGLAGIQLVTFSVEDACGNVATCQATIGILDSTPPVFTSTPADVTLACGSGIPTGNATAVDGCGDVTINSTDDVVDGDCSFNQTITRTFIATDECGNQSTYVQVITIEDTEAPVFTFVPANVTLTCDESPTLQDATATDNCGNVNITTETDEQPGSCPDNITITRIFTATDECGNQTQATQIITIQDSEAPVFTSVPADYTADCDDILVLDMASAQDNCSTPNVEVQENTNNLGCTQSYTLTRVFTAIDACGNSTQVTQVITVLDEDAPVFSNVPADVTFECTDPNLEQNIQNWLSEAAATDNCGIATITNNYDEVSGCDQVIVTFLATDECGNTSTAQATVSVEGSLTPEITVGSGPALFCGDANNVMILENWLNSAIGTGSCGSVEVSANLTALEILMALGDQPFGVDCLSSLEVVFSAIDQCGTLIEATRTVTLTDDENPVITCPSNLTLECGDSNNETTINSWLQSATAIDNCTNPTVTNDYITGIFVSDCGLTGSQLVQFTTSDACGNTSQCDATITILDTTPPVLVDAPADMTLSCEVAIPAIDGVVAEDLCGSATVTTNEVTTPGACDANFTIIRTFTATDDCNNTSVHTQTITVLDEEAPVFTSVPADLTVQCDEMINFGDATAVDNCGDVTITAEMSEEAGSCATNRIITRTFTSTDECGNTTEAIQTISVIDEEAPVFTFIPTDLTLDCEDDLNLTMATAEDNCGDTNVEVSASTEFLGCDQSYILTRIFTATDECGNTAQATQVISVQDETAPEFTFVPTDLTLECSTASIETIIADWLATANGTDNCGLVSIANNYDGSLDCGAYDITFTASDDCGNTQTANATLSITGSGDLVIEVPPVPQLLCGSNDNLQALTTWLNGATAVGGCGSVQVNADKTAEEILIELNDTLIDAKGECQATVDVTFSTSGLCGEVITEIVEVNLVDSDPPVITCPENLVIECGDVNRESLIADWLETVSAADNCTATTITNTYSEFGFSPGDCGQEEIQFVFFSASDECGNVSNCIATIEIIDTTSPVFTDVPGDLALSCEETIPASSATASDECGSANVVMTEVIIPGACDATYQIVRTFVATDDCGNESTHTQTISITDEEAPEFSFVPSDITLSCDDVIIREDATATDNCGPAAVTVVEEIEEGTCTGDYIITRTFTATDDCGNSSTDTQTITVEDTETPEFTSIPTDFTIECDDAALVATIDSWLLEIAATDNCGNVNITNNYNGSTDCGLYEITFTATDECGNSDTATSSFSISGSGDLEIIIPDLPEIACGSEDNLMNVETWLSEVTAVGGCGDVQVTSNLTAQEIIDLFEASLLDPKGECLLVVEVLFTTSDLCGTSIERLVELTLFDSDPPVITCPDDLTIECGADDFDQIVASWLASVTAVDNCTQVTMSNNYDVNAFTTECGATGSQIVFFMASDECGNQSNCIATIHVIDTTGPEFVAVPQDLTLLCDENIPTSQATAEDLCGGDVDVQLSEATVAGDCEGSYTIIRTFTATDDCGNTSLYTQNISVVDTIAPIFTFVPQDYTISCEETLLLDDATTQDNCSDAIVTVESATIEGDCEGDYMIVRTFTATDDCGNTAIATQTITVTDEVPPMFTSVPADYTISCEEELILDDASATDNCGEVTVAESSETVDGTCENEYTLIRTFTATDDCGNTTTAVQNITVTDEIAPEFTSVPTDYTISCEEELVLNNATATDKCGDPIVTVASESIQGSCDGEYTVVRTFTATDACGNTTTAVQNITVTNEVAPEFTIIPSDYTISCEEELVLENAIAIDNCGAATVTVTDETIEGDCANEYTLVRTFTATDDCGNTNTAVQNITVTDEVAPEFTFVPADYTLSCEEELILTNALATDNCGDAIVTVTDATIAGDCANEYTLIRTFTATDDCGNTTTAVQNITVNDEVAPEFTLIPADYTISCEQELTFDDASATDNCGEAVITEETVTVEGACINDYTLIRTFTATDDCGNTTTAVQTITVTDEIAPEFTSIPADYTISCEQELTFEDAAATDNCGDVIITEFTDTIEGDCVGDYTLVRTFTATDDCGNTTTAVQTITVTDEIAPEFTSVPADYTISCEQELTFDEASATDNCGEVIISEETVTIEGNCVGDYTLIRTFTASDDCGNFTTAVQNIIVTDEIAPEFTSVPADYTISCEQELTFDEATATDNCGEVIITEETETIEGDCAGDYTLIRTFTATDDCGNSTTALQTIIVTDEISPVFTFVPADYTRSCNQQLIFDDATATDNCGEVQIDVTSQTIEGNCAGNYVIIRTFIASDDCGNSTSATQTITVVDEIPPFFTFVPQGYTTSCDEELLLESAIATDNCGQVNMQLSTETIEGTCAGDYSLIRTFLATDECGNTNTATQVIVVVDEQGPEFTSVPEDYTISCEQELIFDPATAEDNCGETTLNTEVETIAGRCEGDYTIIRTFTATDDCGNSTVATQTITVVDEQAPVFISVPADYTAACDEDLVFDDATATDNCGQISLDVTSETISGLCAGQFSVVRTFVATDDCGNSAVASQTITVIDEEAPVFTQVPADLTASCADELAPGDVQATDNCGSVNIDTNTNIIEGDCSGDYTLVRTYIATDECGNTTSATQTITVVDNDPPTFTFVPGNTAISCDQMVPMENAQATDDCGTATITEVSSTIQGSCAGNYTIVRTFTATDACGNASTATQTISVSDTEAPDLASCPPLDMNMDCEGVTSNQQAYVAWHNANLTALNSCATDNCSDVTISSDFDPSVQFSCETGTASVTYTATDECGNSTSQIGTFTINGLAAPELTFTHPELVNLSSGDVLVTQCNSSVIGWEYPTFDESAVGLLNDCDTNFDVTMTENVEGSGDCTRDGYFFRMNYTWTAIDECGNQSELSLIVEIVDTVAPEIMNIPQDVTVTCEQIPAVPYLGTCEDDECCPDIPVIEAFDSCECPSLSFEEVILGNACEGEYQILRTWIAEDNCGNMAIETQTITVINESPLELQFINPDLAGFENNTEITIVCGENGFEEPEWIDFLSAGDVAATYGCGLGQDVEVTYFDFLLEQSNNCQADGFKEKRALVWTAVDGCGNIADLTINLILQDTIGPVIEGLEVACSEDDAVISPFDECGGEVFLTSFDILSQAACDPSLNDVVRIWEASDDCGNTTIFEQRILNEAFDLNPISDIVNEQLANVGSGDIVPLNGNCDGENPAFSMSGFAPEDVMFMDYCGNELETFLVEEVVGSGDCDEEGYFMRTSLTWFAIDECGRRSEYNLLLDIVDETPPVFMDTPSEIFVECGDEVPAAIAIDNCQSIPVFVASEEVIWEGACEGEYDLQRELIAIDACGNFAEMTQIVHFIRTQGPAISGVVEEVCYDQLPEVSAYSRCTGQDFEVTMTEVVSDNDCAQGTLTTRTWTAVDDCGNFTEIVQRVYSEDFEAPSLVWANSDIPAATNGGTVTLNCGSGDNSADSIDENSVIASNECSVEVDFNISEIPASCESTGFIAQQQYEWVVTDPCGNQSIFSLVVNLVDVTAPEFIDAPQDTTLFCSGLPAVQNVIAVDNCSNVTVDFNEERIDSDRFEVQRYRRTWIATDGCGNQNITSQIISLEEKPDFHCEFPDAEMPICNKKDNQITVQTVGGRAPFTYLWSIEGIGCEIVSGQGTDQVTYRYGFASFRIKVIVIDADGCVTECSIQLECNPAQTNNLNEGDDNENFSLEINKVFPNPVSVDLFIEYSTSKNNTAILRIVDALGREVRREKVALEEGKHILHQHVKSLQPGHFHIELISHDQVGTRRFLRH